MINPSEFESELTFVIQGPNLDQQDDQITSNLIMSIRKYFPKAPIVFSTWDGEKIELLPYLEKIVFTVETKNEFSRTFNVTINLFDASKNIIYTLNPTVVIPPNSGVLTTEIEIPKEDIGLVINAQYIEFLLAMSSSSDGSIISPSDPSVLNFKSYVELFLNYTTTQ